MSLYNARENNFPFFLVMEGLRSVFSLSDTIDVKIPIQKFSCLPWVTKIKNCCVHLSEIDKVRQAIFFSKNILMYVQKVFKGFMFENQMQNQTYMCLG